MLALGYKSLFSRRTQDGEVVYKLVNSYDPLQTTKFTVQFLFESHEILSLASSTHLNWVSQVETKPELT